MTITATDLSHFTGTQTLFYTNFFGTRFNYTDGVKFLRDNGCDWLVTDMLSHLTANPDVKCAYAADPFLVVEFKRTEHGFDLEIRNDEGDVLAVDHRITNAIDTEVKFYVMEDNFIILASEY